MNKNANQFNTFLLNIEPISNTKRFMRAIYDWSTDPSHDTATIKHMAYQRDNLATPPNIVSLCAEYMYAINFYRVRYSDDLTLFDTMTYRTGNIYQIAKCKGIYAKNSSISFAFIYYPIYQSFKYATIDYDAGKYNLQDLGLFNGMNNMLKGAKFVDENNSYFIGDVFAINFAARSYSYANGVVMSKHNGQSCVAYELLESELPMTYLVYWFNDLPATELASGISL